ncbi:hypothetical protein BGX31_011238 [Mortierella sp. GBA43]|nr:hypothetical protein BGX31_011238 [Mortierella sp. GBA43]
MTGLKPFLTIAITSDPSSFSIHTASLHYQTAPATNFSNLIHLNFCSPRPSFALWRDNAAIYELLRLILSQNPGIQELQWESGYPITAAVFIESILKHTTKHLKRLSITGYFAEQELEIVKYLIEANEKRQLQGESSADGAAGSNQDVKFDGSSDRGCSGLDELMLRDINYSFQRHEMLPSLDLTGLDAISGDLPIRSLSLIDYETDIFYDYYLPITEPQEPNGSLIAILQKCPHLEKLCVSFDISSVLLDTSSSSFLRRLSAEPHYTKEMDYSDLINERFDFVDIMHKSCPSLREIEFGMAYQFTTHHWHGMMKKYGPQLESLSVWGNISRFDAGAFLEAIGPPITYPARLRHHHLTRLNINGMQHLHDCAFVPLHHLPQLKEFRARDVPLDSKQLVVEDGWVCQGLEVLEIFIRISKQELLPKEFHTWIPKLWDVDSYEETADNTSPVKGPEVYLREHQVKICESLGRLSQLRELRIEGEREFSYDCLKLTLETGLDHLAPLQRNLEKLVVSTLSEGLSGRKEVEWIARNWVHHQNSHWLRQHGSESSESLSALSQSLQDTTIRDDDERLTGMWADDGTYFAPSPKFKELIGISVNDMHQTARVALSNIEWLKEQCPSLRVHVV